MKLARTFYTRSDTVAAARELLGKLIVVPDVDGRRVSGMIVETEAYLGYEDQAAHSFGGRRTQRNEVTYGVGGHAYVFFIYGMYYQFNIVCGPIDSPNAVLIRALEPIDGIELMSSRRQRTNPKDLASGPGKLCIAMNIDRSLNGEDLLGDRIWIEKYRSFDDNDIAVGKRIGIDYAGEDASLPLRFWVRDNKFASKPRQEI